MSNITLKRCPFCDGKAVLMSYKHCDCCGKAYNGIVMCTDCEAKIDHRDNDRDAVNAWNRRAECQK